MGISDMSDQDHNITAFFGTREAAEGAIARLLDAGLARDKILLRIGAARKALVEDDKSLLQEVKELVLPSETPDAVVETVKQDGFVLTVRPDADQHDAILDMLKQDGGLGIESRDDVWPTWKADPAEGVPDPTLDADAEIDGGAASSDHAEPRRSGHEPEADPAATLPAAAAPEQTRVPADAPAPRADSPLRPVDRPEAKPAADPVLSSFGRTSSSEA